MHHDVRKRPGLKLNSVWPKLQWQKSHLGLLLDEGDLPGKLLGDRNIEMFSDLTWVVVTLYMFCNYTSTVHVLQLSFLVKSHVKEGRGDVCVLWSGDLISLG